MNQTKEPQSDNCNVFITINAKVIAYELVILDT